MKAGEFYQHKPTGTIGRLKAIHEPGHWKTPMGCETFPEGIEAPTCEVVEFETGDAFMHNPENFRLLTEKEVAFYAMVRITVQKAVNEMGQWGASSGVDMNFCVDVVAHVLGLQAAALK
jgi:hypothetical protein